MKKKKVLQLIDGLNLGGAEILLINLVHGIKEAGYEVCVGYCTYGLLIKDLVRLKIPSIHLPCFYTVDPFLLLRMCQLILREKPDIVHTHLFKSDLHGLLAARLCGVPVVISTSHNMDVWARRFPLGYIYGLVTNLTDRVIAVSNVVRDYQILYTKILPEKIIVIENGINSKQFTNQVDAGNALRYEFQIGMDAPLVGIIGRLKPQKDHSNFLLAAIQIRNKMPNTHFLIVGDGPLRDQLVAQAQSLGLGSSVIFCGIRKDIHTVLSALDMLVISSKWEGLPVTLLEGMAAGLPIVATAVGSIPEVLRDGEMGLIVAPSNPKDLANACLRLINSPVIRQRMGEAAHMHVKLNFSNDVMVNKIVDLYQELMQMAEG